MVNSGPSEHHGVVIGPLGRVAPALLVAVPEVTAGRVAHESVGKALPYGEREIHLDGPKDERLERKQHGKRQKYEQKNKLGMSSDQGTEQKTFKEKLLDN